MKRPSRQVTTPHERARARLMAGFGHVSNDLHRALELVDLVLIDDSGGESILSFSDEQIIAMVTNARKLAAQLRELEAEERDRGELTVVRGGRK
jgi:hypothetical protein